MRSLRPAWVIATLTSLAAIALVLFLHVIYPVGKLDAERYEALDQIMEEHLATIDDRLQEIELYADTPIVCPLTWSDSIRRGSIDYTLDTTVRFAHYDEVRADWVPTCDEGAEYYAVTLEGSWRTAPTPQVNEYAAPRYYGLAQYQLDTTLEALPGEEGHYEHDADHDH